MRESLGTILSAGAVAALVSFAVASWVGVAPQQTALAQPALLPSAAQASAADVAEEWQFEVELLRERVAQLEAALVERGRDVVPDDAPVAVETQELREFVAALRQPGDSLPPSLVTGVENALQQIQEEQRRERDVERQAERERRIDERVATLTERLGLDATQAQDVRSAIAAFEGGRQDLKQARESGVDAKEVMRALKADFDDALLTALSPAQFEEYQTLRKDKRESTLDKASRFSSTLEKLSSKKRSRGTRGGADR